MTAPMTVVEAAGHHAEVRIRGRVEHDAYGYHITEPSGRRWNLQWDDLVTPAPALEVAPMGPDPKPTAAVATVRRNGGRPCEPDCQGYADYAAVPCPNPACDDRVMAAWERATSPGAAK